jgi:hypothetical protein
MSASFSRDLVQVVVMGKVELLSGPFPGGFLLDVKGSLSVVGSIVVYTPITNTSCFVVKLETERVACP